MLIADVSGFTALTEARGGQGSTGVELLTKCMNRYFTKVRWLDHQHSMCSCVRELGGCPCCIDDVGPACHFCGCEHCATNAGVCAAPQRMPGH